MVCRANVKFWLKPIIESDMDIPGDEESEGNHSTVFMFSE